MLDTLYHPFHGFYGQQKMRKENIKFTGGKLWLKERKGFQEKKIAINTINLLIGFLSESEKMWVCVPWQRVIQKWNVACAKYFESKKWRV